MALRGKKKTSKKKTAKKKAQWVTLGDLAESDRYEDDDGNAMLYFKASDYKGKLLWFDEENERYYEIKSASVFEPHEDAPDFLVKRIAVNLKNDKCATVLEDGEESEEEED